MQPRTYRSYLLGLLTAILLFNFLDRLALGLAAQDIETSLHMTDTQLGLLTGLAFALFYSLWGIPIARWADRGNRNTIVSLTTAVWSVMVSLCGLASNFLQLALIRVAVGVGEAGCIPPAQSLIADYFDRSERALANAVYLQGANLSVVIGYLAGGWLNQLYGWRAMFVFIGLPGLVIATCARLTVREPRLAKPIVKTRRDSVDAPDDRPLENGSIAPPRLTEVLLALWRNQTFRHLLYANSLLYFFSYGIMQWQPAFFVREFGLTSGQIGVCFALVYGVGGLLGTSIGGAWAARYAADNERLQLRLMAMVNAGCNGVIWGLVYFAHDYRVALALMAVATLGGTTINGPMAALPQTLVPPRMRAVASATALLLGNLVGMGLGPLAVGVLSDALRAHQAVHALRYSLLAMSPGYLWLSWHLWQASKTVTSDIAAQEAGSGGSSVDIAS
jgi:MFS transporter, Spinster family, sphingosine-1-phosphate transporter